MKMFPPSSIVTCFVSADTFHQSILQSDVGNYVVSCLSSSLILIPGGLRLLSCGYSQKREAGLLPFHLPAPKGLIISKVSAPKSSMSGEKCSPLNYALPLPLTHLEVLLLGSFSSLNLTSTFDYLHPLSTLCTHLGLQLASGGR